jgi:hypothetical protein
MACWLNATSFSSFPSPVGRNDFGGAGLDYYLVGLTSGGNQWEFGFAGSGSTKTSDAPAATGWQAVIAWFDSVAAVIRVQIECGTIYETSTSGLGTPNTLSIPFTIGANAAGSFPFTGAVADVVLADAAWTQGSRDRFSAMNRIVCDGNSLTEGYLLASPSTESYPAQLQAALNSDGRYKVTNLGVTGQTVQDMAGDAASQIDAVYPQPTNAGCIVVANEVINSIYVLDDTADEAVDAYWSYCDARRTAGMKVIACTCTDWPSGAYSADPSVSTRITAANVRIRAEWASHAEAIADIQADSRMQDNDDTAYFDADKVHWTAAAATVAAGIVRTAILSI